MIKNNKLNKKSVKYKHIKRQAYKVSNTMAIPKEKLDTNWAKKSSNKLSKKRNLV